MRALSTRLDNLTQEVRPVPKVGRCRSNPTTRTVSTSQFVTRVVRVANQLPSSSNSVSVKCSDVATALGFSSANTNAAFRVQDVKVWNVTNAGATTNYVSVTALAKLFTSGTTVLTASDYGTASHLPGVHVNVPNTLTQLNTSTADDLLTVTVDPTGVAPASRPVQTLCYDVWCLVRY